MPHEFVVVQSFSSEIEANLVIAELEDAGITACIINPVNPNMFPRAAFIMGFDVAVRDEDAEAAREFLSKAPALPMTEPGSVGE